MGRANALLPHMNEKGISAIERLIKNVETQRNLRDREQFDPADTRHAFLIEEREKAMDEVVEVSGLSLKKLQTALGISRTTWDRWKKFENIPNKAHLLHLERLINDSRVNRIDDATGTVSRPLQRPLDFITSSPLSYGQLRVLFLYANYRWKNAVFHFRKPFKDDWTVVDMAAMALNGCHIAYLIGASTLGRTNGESFLEEFVQRMVSCLGREVSSTALGNFCFVEITDQQDNELVEFGVLNMWDPEEDDRVGYIWDVEEQGSAEEHLRKPNQYRPKLANDQIFDPLREEFKESLLLASKAIAAYASRGAEYGYDDDARKHFIQVLKFKSQTNQNETEPDYYERVFL